MKMLTTQDAAKRLGVTVRRVNYLIMAGRLPAERFGRAYMIQEPDLKLVEDRPTGRPAKSDKATPSSNGKVAVKKSVKKGGEK